jgi:organic hydroperoxide reductase OsmC/OhrA
LQLQAWCPALPDDTKNAPPGVLARVGQEPQFTHYTTFAKLTVPAATHAAKARELLEQAERGCLIANSLGGTRDLEAQVITEDPANARRIGEPASVST